MQPPTNCPGLEHRQRGPSVWTCVMSHCIWACMRGRCLFAALLTMVACEPADGPCQTKGAVRRHGACDCPSDTTYNEAQNACEPFDAGGSESSAARDGATSFDGSRRDDGSNALEANARAADAQLHLDGTAVEAGASRACSPMPEVCNGIDEDCDGTADNGLRNACGAACGHVVPPEDCGTPQDDDCDGVVNEGCTPPSPSCVPSPEVCDGKDQDCDGVLDDGVRNACQRCGEVPPETCDGMDNDCDGDIDEGVKTRCWVDADMDGRASLGAPATESCRCGPLQTAMEPVAGKADCDDRTSNRSPALAETCGDDVDNDCDGSPDDGCVPTCGTGTNQNCMPCSNDTHCASSTPWCDATSGKCVQCLTTSNCSPGNACENRQCVKLCGNGRVDAGEGCDPKAQGWDTFTCSPSCQRRTVLTTCSSTTDCLDGARCTTFPAGYSTAPGVCVHRADFSSQCPAVEGFTLVQVSGSCWLGCTVGGGNVCPSKTPNCVRLGAPDTAITGYCEWSMP